jgi:hypothetical protein
MSEIPPTPNPTPSPTPPLPQPQPPPDNSLIPSWFYSFNVLLLIIGVIVVLVVVYLTYKLLVKNVNTSDVKVHNSKAANCQIVGHNDKSLKTGQLISGGLN